MSTLSQVEKSNKQETPQCMVCGSKEKRFIRDRLRYGIIRPVYECSSCGFVYLWPRMGEEETVEYYKKGDYRNIPREKLGLQQHDSKATFNSRMGQAKQRFDIVKPYLNKNVRFLEIGCGSGSFLSLVKPLVKECKAMELDPIFAEYVQNELKIDVSQKAIIDLDPAKDGKFDVVCMWFVLEHLHDPVNDLKSLRKIVADGGVLLMLLPNLLDPLLTIYRSEAYSDFFYQLPHLNYFSPTTLKLAMEKSGWKGKVIPIQIYSLQNHLRWAFVKKPQAKQGEGVVSPFNLVEKLYRYSLSKMQKTDSLLAVLKKD